MEVCLQIGDRREDYHRHNKEKRRKITNDTAAVKISSRLEILTYMCISICKHKPPTHTQRDRRKYTTGKGTHPRSHTAQSLQSKMSEKLSGFHKAKQVYLFIYGSSE